MKEVSRYVLNESSFLLCQVLPTSLVLSLGMQLLKINLGEEVMLQKLEAWM